MKRLRAVALALGLSLAAHAQQPPPAAVRLNEAGPESKDLAREVGTWDCVATFRASPDAQPMVTKGLIAERALVGAYLQETLRPAPGSGVPDFRRVDYLYYSRVEGRWQYVSLDTRFPVGIMPAWSWDKQSDRKITLVFEPLAFVGLGPEVQGTMVRSNMVITRDGDHQTKQQFWVQADGTGREWLAVQYEYTRRR